jgi:NADH-quinone oxidoreductase subunit J
MLALASLAAGAATVHPIAIAIPVAASVVPPVLILVLCAVAGIGTVLLLPGRKDAPLRKIGGAVTLAAGLILAALLVRGAAESGGMGVYFWLFSAIALAGAIRVVTHPRPVYSAMYFVLTVLATAGLFVLLWAEFMAAALVLIYAGAILVTYVFVIMLAAEAADPRRAGGTTGALSGLAEHDAVSRDPLIASAVGFLLMGVLLFVIFERMEGQSPAPPPRSFEGAVAVVSVPAAAQASAAAPAPGTAPAEAFVPEGGVQQLGAYLFNRQLVNLELAGLILTVAMVGAIIIARKRVTGTEPADAAADAGADVVHGPATPIDDNPHSIPVYGTENPRHKAYPET